MFIVIKRSTVINVKLANIVDKKLRGGIYNARKYKKTIVFYDKMNRF